MSFLESADGVDDTVVRMREVGGGQETHVAFRSCRDSLMVHHKLGKCGCSGEKKVRWVREIGLNALLVSGTRRRAA